jgi:short subunit dehydrogenase-like uncharacterized protein
MAEYDVVLFGATGFTGALTAEYLAQRAPDGLRWALAGRSAEKLEALAERLPGTPPGVLVADVTDEASLRRMAESARVVITTVGPYVRFGEPVVAACAEAGTDYVDLTGEPEFVDRMYVAHHARAVETGARIVHACGFDSIPHDLGVYFTVQQLPEDVPLRIGGYLRAGGRFSGGTYASALTAVSRPRQNLEAARARRKAESRPAGRRISAGPGRLHAEPLLGWAVPLPTIDPQIVARSAAALDRYGPDFGYRHHALVKHLPTALGGMAGVGALAAAVQVPPVRDYLLGRMTSGDGPSPEQRAKGWFSVRFIARAGDQRLATEVSGGDPGYGETAKMLAESALCLAQDDLPQTAGQVTTAVAMGDALLRRLQDAGMRFEVLAPV